MERFIKLDEQWSILHLPDKPNGFAVLIIGDTNHYVTDSSSLWVQSMQRHHFIETLRKEGYTIFYSNLFGANWGSWKAVTLLKQMYHFIQREEIVNDQVHIIAEGMGGITALRLQEELNDNVRSLAMLSPCLDLKKQAEKEKTKKLFYKKFIKELASAYDVDERMVNKEIIEPFNLEQFNIFVPIKIWHATDRVAYLAEDHSRKLEHQLKHSTPISLSLHLFEKRFNYAQSIIDFFHNHEKVL